MSLSALSFAPLLAYWYFGWWWWWWIAIFLLWMIFLPPFGYGRRWYGRYRGGYGAAPPAARRSTVPLEWEAIESEFAAEPRAAVVDADDALAPLVATSASEPVIQQYRHAHAVAEKARRGLADHDELRSAMNEFRTVFRNLQAQGS